MGSEGVPFVVREYISLGNIKQIDSIVFLLVIEIADFKVSALLIIEELDKHDPCTISISASCIVLNPLNKRRVLWEDSPADLVQNFGGFVID
jgi:hypothetical protein